MQCAPSPQEPPQEGLTASKFNDLWNQVSPAQLTHKKMRIIGEHDKRKFTTVIGSDTHARLLGSSTADNQPSQRRTLA